MSEPFGTNTLAQPSYDFTPKYELMTNISIGFVIIWIFVGIILAWYVYTQTQDADQKTNFAL